MTYSCCARLRRDEVARDASLNGIDYLEVLDHDAPAGIERQQTLLVRCLQPIAPVLTAANVTISRGEAGHQVNVVWAAPASAVPPISERPYFGGLPDPTSLLIVRTDGRGDYSTYTLDLVTSPTNPEPPAPFDSQLASVDFSFKVECESDFDCGPSNGCSTRPEDDPDIDYLAKDYASFRRMLLDRMARNLPGLGESTPADQFIALAEVLAYVGDRLSYQQDAIATEATIGTARRRVSLRRHALLTDYRMHDGRNARAWVVVQVVPGNAADGAVVAKDDTQFLTRAPGVAGALRPASAEYDKAMVSVPVVFEPLHDLTLRVAHVTLPFYTWSDRECCLPQGATTATLQGHFPDLGAGLFLVLEEVKGPRTGVAADADPHQRHVVRLREVNCLEPGGAPLRDPLTGDQITAIRWDAEDALPFPMCVSARSDNGVYIDEVTVARGNVVLVDHGRTIHDEPLGAMPQPTLYAPPSRDDPCKHGTSVPIPARFRPLLAGGPLTQAGPASGEESAHAAMNYSLATVTPAIDLVGTAPDGHLESWHGERDLLRSKGTEHVFVVETEYDGSARLRFGDSTHGLRPPDGTQFAATYRIGNGRAGNVGAEGIFHVVTHANGVAGARNPVPAMGGLDPETADEVRRRAPEAFRTQERAVTPQDYADRARRSNPADIQRAVATLRWTGSWHTVFIAPDPLAGHTVDASALRQYLEMYRMAGHDLEINSPHWVSLEIAMSVCVRPDYFRSHVRAALLDVFRAGRRQDGRLGVFHPDNFSFGEPVYLSPLYAAARQVPGVASLEITAFQRQGIPTHAYIDEGRLPLAPLEIARLENDRSQPEHGVLRIDLRGGK